MTARELDTNGWPEIKGNPISSVGVYPYKGSMVDPNGTLGLNPDKIYNVFRSASELSDPDTIESFKLVPWIEDHEILGNDGIQQTSTDRRPIDGVTGEDIYFRDGQLFANLKLFSGSLGGKIDEGKKELSCGYRCEYELQDGIYGDEEYSVVQTKIRGNHLASVDAGRMGPSVAVLDQRLESFTVDSKDFTLMADKDKDETKGTDEDELKNNLGQDEYDDEKKGEDGGPGNKEDLGQDEDEEKKGEDADEDDDSKGEDGDDKKESNAMDALDTEVRGLRKELKAHKRDGIKSLMREISKRDDLYAKVSPTVGTFDHTEMTVDELAVYACDKLGMKPAKGHEVTALDSYFHNRQPAPVFAPAGAGSFGMDSKNESGAVDSYFSGSAE